VNRRGRILPWLCPNHPENRALELAVVRELATRYPIDGIHLDFIRYPSSSACVCPHCHRAFEAYLGHRVSPWPAALDRPDLHARWLAFRRAVITGFVTDIRALLRREAPRLRLSAAVFPNASLARDTVGQDWPRWCRAGLVDFVCPMSYHRESAAFRADVLRQQDAVAGARVRVFPGIGVSSCRLDANVLAEQISITRVRRTGGFMLFAFGHREARDLLPALKPALP
jgi:uncharacterized lipoprotein YddW (UPF0748 family)